MLVKHQIEIDAPASAIWNLWADIEGWSVWYPGMTAVTKKSRGQVATGTRFIQKMNLNGFSAPVPTTMCEYKEPSRLAWGGGGPGLKVIHTIILEDLGGRTRVRSEETWEGLLSPLAALFREKIDEVTINCLEGLKARAERVVRKS